MLNLLLLMFPFAITIVFVIGYAVGHYEGLRCSCQPQSQHFIRRWLGLAKTPREARP